MADIETRLRSLLEVSAAVVIMHVTSLLRTLGMERRTRAAVYVAQLRDA